MSTQTLSPTPPSPPGGDKAMISLRNLRKAFPNGTVAVENLDMDVADGDLVCLVGPSGCGKTTTLRMINRLIEPTGGQIFIDGKDVTTTNPVELRRGIGYVIQNVGLFPHETVAENIAAVPRLLGWDKTKAKSRSRELLELVGLNPDTYSHRYPGELSGGQRQRVGVARALAADPPVLLMDEPFSAIDPIARHNLQQEFLRVQREVRKTIVMVTHDIDEAVLLGDKVAMFREAGVLEQYDTPAGLLGSPANDFVAQFVGSDRGLRRLGVTAVELQDAENQMTISRTESAAQAAQQVRASGTNSAVVVDEQSHAVGWVALDDLESAGDVAACMRPLPGEVTGGSTLRIAMSKMLESDAGWVAVTDPASKRFIGVMTPSSLHAALRRSHHDLSAAEARDGGASRVQEV